MSFLDLAVTPAGQGAAGALSVPPDLAGRARRYATESKSANTRRAYAGAWGRWAEFCRARGYPALPGADVAVVDYVTALAEEGRKPATIQQALAAIGFAHDNARQTSPVKSPLVRATMAGIRRMLGTAPHRKAPVGLADLRRIVDALPDNLRGARDRALLLIGWAGAFRRSELVALEVADVRIVDAQATITLRRSKTDQEGAGFVKVIPALADPALCPVRALRAWLDAAGIQSGALFRSIDRWGHVHGAMDGREVARIVKGAAERAGIDARQFGGHSLRAGFVTQAAVDGVPAWAIAEVTGHKSQQVLAGYIRAAGRGQMTAIRAAFGEGEAKQ